MKLQVSAELCRGHGRCYTVAPDLLEDDEDEGFVTVRGQLVDVPDDQVDAARGRRGGALPRFRGERLRHRHQPGHRRRHRRRAAGDLTTAGG